MFEILTNCIFRSNKGFPKLIDKESISILKYLNESTLTSLNPKMSRDAKILNSENSLGIQAAPVMNEIQSESFMITERNFNLEQNIGKVKNKESSKLTITKLLPIKMQNLSNYSKLKKNIFERIMNRSKQNSPRLNIETTKRFSLPPTPRVSDPDLQYLIKRFPIVPSSDKLQEINTLKLSKNKSKIKNLIKQ